MPKTTKIPKINKMLFLCYDNCRNVPIFRKKVPTSTSKNRGKVRCTPCLYTILKIEMSLRRVPYIYAGYRQLSLTLRVGMRTERKIYIIFILYTIYYRSFPRSISLLSFSTIFPTPGQWSANRVFQKKCARFPKYRSGRTLIAIFSPYIPTKKILLPGG